MTFLRLRPRSFFQKRVSQKPKKKSDSLNDTNRTCDDSLHSVINLDSISVSLSVSPSLDIPPSPLNKHLPLAAKVPQDRDLNDDDDYRFMSSSSDPVPLAADSDLSAPQETNPAVQHLIRRRINERRLIDNSALSSSCNSSRVSFLDEELGLTPRHVVTRTYYRPRTTDDEKAELFYNGGDFGTFKREELFEEIEDKIREIKRRASEREESGAEDDLEIQALVRAEDDLEIQALVRRVERLAV